MDQRIISNKVYKSLQVPTENTRTTTGKILYANRYSGVATVEMPEDLKALIDSDFGLIGRNLLVQLEQKMKGYANGPWYVDSRDNVIYIHNRKFNEDPVTVYTYQGENGEVLMVSFSTQEITKRVKATLSPTVNPNTKDVSVVSSYVIDDEKDEPTYGQLVMKPFKSLTDNAYYVNAGSGRGDDHVAHPQVPYAIAAEAQMNTMNPQAALKAEMDYKQKMEDLDAKGPVGAFEAALQRKIDETTTEDLRDKYINTGVGALPEDKRSSIDATLKAYADGKGLTTNLQKLIKDEVFMFEKEDALLVPVVEWVNPVDYDPEGVYTDGVGSYNVKNYKNPTAADDRGLQALKDDIHVDILSEPEEDLNRPMAFYNGNQNTGSGGWHHKKIKVRHLKRVNARIPLYRLYSNLFARYGGADRFAWAANANAQGGLKRTERKLICQVQVVGRPMLESSQIIYLDNVGKRWSGFWYIKKCTHTMDPGQGYITDLELVKNSVKAGSSTAKTDVSTQIVVANDAKTQGKTDKGKNKKASSTVKKFNLHWTENECAYFRLTYLDADGNLLPFRNRVQSFTEVIRKKIYYTDVNSKDPVALAEGIAISTGNTVTSTGRLIPGKIVLKDIEVPENYQVNFDIDAIMEAIFKNSLKNKLPNPGLPIDRMNGQYIIPKVTKK